MFQALPPSRYTNPGEIRLARIAGVDSGFGFRVDNWALAPAQVSVGESTPDFLGQTLFL